MSNNIEDHCYHKIEYIDSEGVKATWIGSYKNLKASRDCQRVLTIENL